MACLPQDDPSSTRVSELAKRRERYQWDHEYLPPFPFLHIPYVQSTGVLAIYDVLAGSFAGLPVEEQPPGEWLVRKTLGAGPAIYELLERVPRTHWVGLAAQARQIAKEQLPEWIAHAVRELLPTRGQRRLFRTMIPNASQLANALTELLLRSVDELSGWVISEGTDTPLGKALDVLEDNVERVAVGEDGGLQRPGVTEIADILRGFVQDSVGAIVSNALDSARQLGGREDEPTPLPTNPGRAADPYLSDDVKRIVAPAELLVRFMARMRRYHTVSPDGTMRLSDLVTELPLPTLPDPTTSDVEFGRRTVAGTNPVVLRRLGAPTELAEGFAVRDGDLQRALAAHGMGASEASGVTLASAAQQGRLFWTDYAILDDIPCQRAPDMDFFGQSLDDRTTRQRFLPAPFGLFYRWGDGGRSGLWPVAIQLGRDPQEHDVFTPADDAEVWSRVKALYLTADFNHHEMSTHLAGVHFMLEGFAVATARELHPDHPVAALLRVHTEHLLWNNFLGRQTLTNPRGFTEQLLSGRLEDGSIEIMRRHYRASSFWDLHLPRELKARGVDDRDTLPHYPFRDDGLLLWDALHRFVTAYVQHYYAAPDAMARDDELRAWVEALVDPQGAHVPGFPAEIGTRDVLADVLTAIIFRSSAFHSAVNYGQFDMQSDPGQVPAALYADPRRVRELPLSKYLPGGELTLTQAGVMYVLADLRGVCLADYQLDWFSDPDVWPLVAGLRRDLAGVERAIELANATTRADRPYEYLRPSLVTTTANV